MRYRDLTILGKAYYNLKCLRVEGKEIVSWNWYNPLTYFVLFSHFLILFIFSPFQNYNIQEVISDLVRLR